MSDTFSATPNNIQIKIDGVDGVNRSYQYNYINGTWSLYGMVNPGGGSPILPNESGYIQPQINYTIQGGILNGNINTDESCNYWDFPMWDLDFDMFFVGRYTGNPYEFNSKVCGSERLPSGDVTRPYYKVSLHQYDGIGVDVYAGEYNNNTFTSRTGWVLDGTINNNKLIVNTSSIKYARPYMIDTTFPSNDRSEIFSTHKCKISLGFNMYIIWNTYLTKLINLFTNNSQLRSKYGIEVVNNKLVFDNQTDLQSYFSSFLGYYNYTSGQSSLSWTGLQYIIYYNVTATCGNNIKKFTNLDDLHALDGWSDDITSINNFNDLVNLYINPNSNGATSINYKSEGMDDTDLFNFTTDFMSGYINMRNDQLLNYNTWNYICDFDDLESLIEGETTIADGTVINISAKFLIVQMQYNGDMNNHSNIKFNCKIVEKSKQLNFKYIDYHNQLAVNISDLVLNDKYSPDFPIMYNNGDTLNMTSGSGVYNSFDSTTANTFSAGTVYNLAYNGSMYYNYGKNKKANCSIMPLDWINA